MPPTDLPRIGISITLTQAEADRLDELCEYHGASRDKLIRHSLAFFDQCSGSNLTIPAESVFLRPDEKGR